MNTRPTAVLAGAASVKDHGAVGDGVTDDTAALQAAITATPGQTLYIPRGKYKVTSTLQISDPCHHLVGDFAGRNEQGGTEIVYTGTGPCIQIGTDNGHAWDANEYDGPQDQCFEQIWISHGARDTTTASGAVYKAGAYGIWDWRGGQIVLRSVGIEGFEANFAGIQSDIDLFDYVVSLYSRFGIYIGPRSDQFTLRNLYSFFCDRAVTIDRAAGARIISPQIVGCGTDTIAAIEIRRGSASPFIQGGPWAEHLQGYGGVDQLAFVSVGVVSGYGGPGGSLSSPGPTPVDLPVEGCNIEPTFVYSTQTGETFHTRYFAVVGLCRNFVLDALNTQIHSTVGNLECWVVVPADQSPTTDETQIYARGFSSTSSLDRIFQNLGSGTPIFNGLGTGPGGIVNYTASRFHVRTVGAVPGASEFVLSQEGQPGEFWVSCPQFAPAGGGQATRLRLVRSLQPGNSSSPPGSGSWQRGDLVLATDPSPAGCIGWVCVASGTPGTWQRWGLILNGSTYHVPNNVVLGASTSSTHTINGLVVVVSPAAGIAVDARNSNPGQTAAASPVVRGRHDGTFNTTSGALQCTGVLGEAVATRAAGSSALKNVGVAAHAAGAQINRAIETTEGDVVLCITSGTTTITRSLYLPGEIVPPPLGANQNDYNPAGLQDAFAMILSSTAAVSLTGIAAPPGGGRVLWVFNSGSNSITLSHQGAASAIANRIIGRGNASTVLAPATGALLYYSAAMARWTIIGDSL